MPGSRFVEVMWRSRSGEIFEMGDRGLCLKRLGVEGGLVCRFVRLSGMGGEGCGGGDDDDAVDALDDGCGLLNTTFANAVLTLLAELDDACRRHD